LLLRGAHDDEEKLKELKAEIMASGFTFNCSRYDPDAFQISWETTREMPESKLATFKMGDVIRLNDKGRQWKFSDVALVDPSVVYLVKDVQTSKEGEFLTIGTAKEGPQKSIKGVPSSLFELAPRAPPLLFRVDDVVQLTKEAQACLDPDLPTYTGPGTKFRVLGFKERDGRQLLALARVGTNGWVNELPAPLYELVSSESKA
jgi:hypothetical protein